MAWPIVIATNGYGIPVTESDSELAIPVEIATNGYGQPVVLVDSGGTPIKGGGGWWDAAAVLDADFSGGRFRWGGATYNDETAFLAAIGGSKSGITRTIGPYVAPGAPELVTNGDFAAGTTGWSGYANGGAAATISVASGELVVDGQGGPANGFAQPVTLVVGKAYRMSGTYRRGTTLTYTEELRFSSSAALNSASIAAVGINSDTNPTTHAAAGSAEAASSYAGARLNGATNTGTSYFDDLSLKEVVPFATFTAGSFAALIEATTPAAAAGNKVVLQADGGTTERNRVRVVYDATGHLRVIVTFANTEVANLDLGVVAVSTAFKVALSAANGAFSASLDGQPAVVDASGTFPGIGVLRVGRSFTGETWDGTVERVRVY